MGRTSSLPIDPFIAPIVDRVRSSRAVVVTAQPGAGKTTRVPPALVDDGPVILLQPRRVAARAIASRIAQERGWEVGGEIGWQVRFERRFGPATLLLVVTEGVLTARLQRDPLLSDFRTVVLDEFHERSVHADVAIALAKQAWRARSDLRIVVMSATLDSTAVAEYLDGCPTVDVPGRLHAVGVSYAPGQAVAEATAQVFSTTSGNVLCFLPGAREIRQTISELQARTVLDATEVLPLHGTLDAAAQDAALQPPRPGVRRIVVATNIAETSVTVPGVTAVVDSGLHKVARYDAERAIDTLELERITQDAADQRAGRAGREAPGVVRRLWDARDRLRPHREPDIERVDLAAAVLDVIAWGGDPRRLEWFERPPESSIDAAMRLVERLGAVRAGSLTEIGERLHRLPLHPRLARMLIAADGARSIAQACAILAERHFLPPRTTTTGSDLLSAIDRWTTVPPHVARVAREIEGLAAQTLHEKRRRGPEAQGAADSKQISDLDFRRAVLAGYPDRVAQRREPRSPRVRLASGAGAVIGPESGVLEGEFIVAVDVTKTSGAASARVSGNRARHATAEEARIRIASRVEREWLQPNDSQMTHRFDPASGTVKAFLLEKYDSLVLAERPTAPDPAIAARLLVEAWLERGPDEEDHRLLRRLQFAGRTIDVQQTIERAAPDARFLAELSVRRALARDLLRTLERDAPEILLLPSGRPVPLEYDDDGNVSASVKLQEVFGLGESPRIGPNRQPVRFALLAPNGRPVQVTTDLRSFWDKAYPELRNALRARYPRHPWPENPWTAQPTGRPVGRRR